MNIRIKEGYFDEYSFIVSKGTLNPAHLLKNFMEFAKELIKDEAIVKDEDSTIYYYELDDLKIMVAETQTVFDYMEIHKEYHGMNMDDKTKFADLMRHYLDDYQQFFINMAPDNYYFGTEEGNGSCYGFFKQIREQAV